MEYFTLSNGIKIPAIGSGTNNFGRADSNEYTSALIGDYSAMESALEVGYRFFDTAMAYGNEDGIGNCLKKSGIPREELFIMGKIPNRAPYNVDINSVREAVDKSLKDLGLEYFDMFIIHKAVDDSVARAGGKMDLSKTVELWNNLVVLYKEGKLRGIGVSNFEMEHIAETLGIPMDTFHWYAAFHDEGAHPHVHMMVWSDQPDQGFLTPDGIETMRSKLTNTIFKDELQNLYVQKDLSYKELTYQAQDTMRELVQKMQSRIYISPVIEQKMQDLVSALEGAKGKKQYGYLNKETKQLVDSIVDALAIQPEVAQCYEVWNLLRDELEGYYKEKPREHLPLSRQKEFRVIKNMVIREAENIRLGVYCFEDEQMDDEPRQDIPLEDAESVPMEEILHEPDAHAKYPSAERLERLWHEGRPFAAHLLGKLYRDGVEVPVNLSKAEQWFRISAEAGNDLSEYAIGKMLLEQNRFQEALGWLNRSASNGNSYAMYRLGKLYLSGEATGKDTDAALQYFTAAAERGNPYAQYALGKLYLQGREVPRDTETALRWLEHSAAQGNVYAQYLLDRADESRDPSLLLSATKLLHHMSRIFQNNAPPANPQGIRIDSKRRRQLLEKRLALGHKIDDHEDYVPTQNWEQRM